MKIALLADIHANREALTACLDHARALDAGRYVFLGDLVGYGADPVWVVDCVMQHVRDGALAVLGNHDEAVARASRPTMHRGARMAVEWTRRQLSAAQLEFLASLAVSIEAHGALFVHANAWAPREWDYILSATEARASLHSTRCAYTFCGHIHEPALYHMNASSQVAGFVPTPDTLIPLGRQRRWLAIPGSVGQPRDGVLAARYAIFDDSTSTLTYFEVPYDFQAALAKTLAAGLPPNIVVRSQGAAR
jgi:diadenosine tetraphosphatase ApaH/serine/threonine PP2A family protein phosphatase